MNEMNKMDKPENASPDSNPVMQAEAAGKKKPGIKKLIILIAAVVVVIAVVLVIVVANGSGGKTTFSASAELEKVLEISELSTVTYTYNAIATKYDDNGKAVYYVSYNGTAEAGIDFSKIKIESDDENKTATITLPDVEIFSVNAHIGTGDYIFNDSSYNDETVAAEANSLCQSDLEDRVKNDENFLRVAKENAMSTIEALVTPWFEQVAPEYEIVIK